VTDIEVKEQSPVGHGAVICFSIYAGPDVDFNRGQFKSPSHDQKQDRIWVDVWNEIETYVDNTGRIRPVMLTGGKVKLKDHHPILDAFKTFFEDVGAKKAWHNYGFDRHVLANMGIECQGFGADTLHMARLLDASRRGKKNYGLDSLTDEKDVSVNTFHLFTSLIL
jgi:DNA polymerase I-like protein with 3'-5' exonuclease and polymerase domains